MIIEIMRTIFHSLPNALCLAMLLLIINRQIVHKKNCDISNGHILVDVLFLFYISLLTSITLLTRNYQPDPFVDVKGKWFLKYKSGSWHRGNIENILLFVPLCPLVMAKYNNNDKLKFILGKGLILSISVTGIVEVLQIVLHRGTFQLTDMFFNSVGGVIGLVGYMVVNRLFQSRKTISSEK